MNILCNVWLLASNSQVSVYMIDLRADSPALLLIIYSCVLKYMQIYACQFPLCFLLCKINHFWPCMCILFSFFQENGEELDNMLDAASPNLATVKVIVRFNFRGSKHILIPSNHFVFNRSYIFNTHSQRQRIQLPLSQSEVQVLLGASVILLFSQCILEHGAKAFLAVHATGEE